MHLYLFPPSSRSLGVVALCLSGLAARVDPRALLLAVAFAVAACSALVVHCFLTGKDTRS